MDRTNDAELISQFRDPALRDHAFRMILAKYQEKLYWHIRRMVIVHEDTDDVLQNTFIKIWKGLAGFRETSGLYTWMYRIATNESITFLKMKQLQRSRIADDPDDLIKGRLKSDPYFDGDELYQRLLLAVEGLPAKQKRVFQMKYFDEMTYEEIEKVLGTSVGALKASYFHAVRKIQASFESSD
jgi:RNA polymerase sigma-70 factor, ECF subfamily